MQAPDRRTTQKTVNREVKHTFSFYLHAFWLQACMRPFVRSSVASATMQRIDNEWLVHEYLWEKQRTARSMPTYKFWTGHLQLAHTHGQLWIAQRLPVHTPKDRKLVHARIQILNKLWCLPTKKRCSLPARQVELRTKRRLHAFISTTPSFMALKLSRSSLSTWGSAQFQSHETQSSENECLKSSLCTCPNMTPPKR